VILNREPLVVVTGTTQLQARSVNCSK